MCFEKEIVKTIACPHLKGSGDSALCSFEMERIKNMTDADIRFCAGSHYEACHFYVRSIRRSCKQPSDLPLQ